METKKIFVIMPFKKSPTRDSDDLTEFYKTNIKEFIESCSDFKYRYKVTRSEDAFDIQDQIIKDLYAADIVLCDLSGKNANPNVMYELGVRFGVSPKPVILFREEHEENDSIFDVYGFHTFYYKATQYSKLQNHIKKKILDYEEDISRYESPVIKILKRSMSIEKEVERRKAYSLMISLEYGAIGMIRNAAGALNELFEDNSTLEMPPKYNDAISYIVKNYGEIKDLDFSRFYFRPNRFPSLETFITDLPLRDLIEESIELKISSFIREYFNRFFSTNRVWETINATAITLFVGESGFLEYLCDSVQALLKETDKDKAKDITDQINAIIDGSNLMSNK